MSVIRWEDPPPKSPIRQRARRREYWAECAEALRDQPGRWAVLVEDESWSYAGGLASQINAGRFAAFRPSGTFKAVTRTVGLRYVVYVRYIGEAES